MDTILHKICKKTQETIARDKAITSVADIKSMCKDADKNRGFAQSLQKHSQTGFGLIAEIKKASPSAGLIRPDFNPEKIAKAYKNAGASCLSVLTDEPFFQGHSSFLKQARNAVDIPILRKDFMLDTYQFYQAKSWGADCVLLIASILSDDEIKYFEDITFSLDMDCIIEVHDEAEMERALRHSTTPLIGINNRNLKIMQTDISTTEKLSKMVTENRHIISESGLKTFQDLQRMEKSGVKSFLIGEHLMAQDDVEYATRTILGNQ